MTDKLNAVSKTAYYTCAIRALDAGRPNSICNDTYADRFIEAEGKAIAAQVTASPGAQSGVSARHKIIDDLLHDLLTSHSDAAIVIVGAGFDTRAFRIPGGHWYEIDEAPVIELKNKLVPVSECRNSLQRISIDFSTESLESRLPSIDPSRKVLVITEGVLYYLSEFQIMGTFTALQNTYPKHTLICDLLDRVVATRYSSEVLLDIERLGAKWVTTPDQPVRMVEKAGYNLRSSIFILDKMLDYKKAGRIERFLARLLLPKLRQGAGVYVFDCASSTSPQ